MKPLQSFGADEKSSATGATAAGSPATSSELNDENFNFDDLANTDIADDHQAAAAAGDASTQEVKLGERGRDEVGAEQTKVQVAPRSPSPSTLSTTSSAAPLIRSNSTSSSISSGSALGASAATGGKPRGPSSSSSAAAALGALAAANKRRAHLAPTSIAVAQLQQQQQRQLQEHNAAQQALDKSSKVKSSSPKMSKFQSGNKLAQMANQYQYQYQYHNQYQHQQHVSAQTHTNGGDPKKVKAKKALGAGSSSSSSSNNNTKSLGYKLGKSLVHRASRFDEFWSVNKMRCMNLACLLMTLVCLITILLFSKSNGGVNGPQQAISPAASSLTSASKQQLDASNWQAATHSHRLSVGSSKLNSHGNNGGGIGNSQRPHRQQQAHRFTSGGEHDNNNNNNNNGGHSENEIGAGDNEQEHPMESIDSIDKQPFVRNSSGGQKRALGGGDGGDDEDCDCERKSASSPGEVDVSSSGGSQQTQTQTRTTDGFNLFDDRHDENGDGDGPYSFPAPSFAAATVSTGGGIEELASAPGKKRSFDDLLQEARRQLKRQQESERESEESTAATTTTASSSSNGGNDAGDKLAASAQMTRQRSLDPFFSQVLGDLDNFALFKAIKSQLLDQLQGVSELTLASPAANNNNNSSSPTGNSSSSSSSSAVDDDGKPIIRRSKEGATIIMRFGGGGGDASLKSDKQANESSLPPGVTSSALSAIERMLLPPPLAKLISGIGLGKPQIGFARITLESKPLMTRILRTATPLSFGASPFLPSPAFMSSGLHGGAQALSSDDESSPTAGTTTTTTTTTGERPPAMIMPMLMRVPSKLALRMEQYNSAPVRQQEAGANQTAQVSVNATTAATNSTNLASSTSDKTRELKAEASQQVKVATNIKSQNESADDDDEVELFDPANVLGLHRQQSPFSFPHSGPAAAAAFRSLYTGAAAHRRASGAQATSPLIMISSSSAYGSPFGGNLGESSGPFVSLLPPPQPPLSPFASPASPMMLMMSGGGGLRGGHSSSSSAAAAHATSLGSMLSDVMSTMAADVAEQQQQQNRGVAAGAAVAAASRRSGRGDDEEPSNNAAEMQQQQDDEDDDEQVRLMASDDSKFTMRLTRPRHRSLEAAAAAAHDVDSERSSVFPPAFGSPAGSLLEHMLGAAQQRRPMGTSVVTVERIIGPGAHANDRRLVGHHQVVPSGVRSQSLSRMDNNSEEEHSEQQQQADAPSRAPAFARMMRELESSEVPTRPRLPSVNRQPISAGGLISRLFSDLSSDSDDAPPPNIIRARSDSSNNDDAIDSPEDEDSNEPEQQAPWMMARSGPTTGAAKIARVRIMSSSRAAPELSHFTVSAAGAPAFSSESRADTPHTSPHSPLFGFPAMKPSLESLGIAKAAAAAAAAAAAPSPSPPSPTPQDQQPSASVAAPAQSRRQQRAFVYHSNHEVAQHQQHPAQQPQSQQPPQVGRFSQASSQDQIRSRSNVAPPPPPPPAASASMVMGRRLDDFVERR